MNGKQAKHLRQQAKANTVRQPKVQYKELGKAPRYYTMNMTPVKVAKGTPRQLSDTCTRSVYKELKKAYKA